MSKELHDGDSVFARASNSAFALLIPSAQEVIARSRVFGEFSLVGAGAGAEGTKGSSGVAAGAEEGSLFSSRR